MDITPQTIKNWLKSSGHSRDWLAAELYVSKSTINNWLANVYPIPYAKKQLIKHIITSSYHSPSILQLTPNDIKAWLKSSGHSREWLASQLLVTKSTINSWLANVHPIPHIKLQYIKNLMHPHSTSRDLRHDDILTVTVRFTPDEWAAMLPPEIDPNDQASAEKYIRNRLTSPGNN